MDTIEDNEEHQHSDQPLQPKVLTAKVNTCSQLPVDVILK